MLRVGAAVTLLLLALPPPSATALKYIAEWCHIGCLNITTSHTWANVAIPKHDNARTTDGFWNEYKTPSLLPMPADGVWTRNMGMDPGWEAVLGKFAAEVVLPRLANQTTIGVFLGDEMCCRNTSCWHDQLYPISAKLRSLLGKKAILWSNECAIPALFDKLDKIPPDLDWISVDGCEPRLPPHHVLCHQELTPRWVLPQTLGMPQHNRTEHWRRSLTGNSQRRTCTRKCRPRRNWLSSQGHFHARTFPTCRSRIRLVLWWRSSRLTLSGQRRTAK